MSMQAAHLILSQFGERRAIYPLPDSGEVKIGRSPENDIVLNDERCSRHHATVRWEEPDWVLRDQGSRNGTLVDNQPFANPFLLRSGSQIQIGHSVLQFEPGVVPGDEDTEYPDPDTVSTGVFGIERNSGSAPRNGEFDPSMIVHHRNKTSFLKETEDENAAPDSQTTRLGHDAADLCKLAFSLGTATEIDEIAQLSLEGLLDATEGYGAGLWLFPRNVKGKPQAADLRLIAHVTRGETAYTPISESLAKAVLERKEAVLVNDKEKSRKKTEKSSVPWEGGEINNTLSAPIRDQSNILGLVHLYTMQEHQNLELNDLEYALAVADTIAVALGQLNRQKELTANLNQARKENTTLRELLQVETEIIGSSPPMKKVGHLIARAAEGKATLLIRGESGTGKELIARAVHFASPRRNKPLICLNCAAISESLLASELFGHEKGAFTGATDRKMGKFEAAHTGTLFLDEIGEMTPMLQSKLLRVLEGHPFERVGGNAQISVDVRVIAATNRDLEKEVAMGRFRHDLFFRLRVLEIIVPPLRKRVEDIPILADFFLDKYSKETGRKYQGFSPEAQNALLRHRWPGNVRELKNVIERAVVLSSSPWIQEQDLLLSTLSTTGETDISRSSQPSDTFSPLTLEEVEKVHIQRTLDFNQWNKSLTAKTLGIERTTLDRKIKRYELEK